MIQIDEAKKEIVFIPDKTKEEHPPQRSFSLLSGYVCPFCKRVLAAYFQGFLSESDIAYYREENRYAIGSVPGGHYVKLENHQGYSYYGSDNCSWELFSGRGVAENLRLFVEQHELPRMLVPVLREKTGKIPGFAVVRDVCGRDKEMLLFSEDELLRDVRKRKGFDAYWEVKQSLGDYLMKLAGEVAK